MPEKIKGVYEREPGSGVWWIRYTDEAGKLKRKKAGRRSDAQLLLAKLTTEVLQRKTLPEKYKELVIVKFGALCDDALEHSRDKNDPKVTEDLRLKIDRMRPDFGPRDAASITRQDITRWLTAQAEERNWKNSTRNRWQAAFSLVYRVGVNNEKIAKNPAAGIERRKESDGRARYLSDKEESRLQKVIADKFPGFLPQLDLSLHTGMRASEQFTLRWGQIDLQRRTLYLPKTKNGKPRHIPLNAVAVTALEAMRKPGVSYSVSSDRVFPSARRDGEGLKSARGWFTTALREAKISDYTWHCNRHTFASRLVMAGVDIRTVGELLGHKSLSMTMRYSHLAPEHNQAAVDRLVQRLERQLTPELTPAG